MSGINLTRAEAKERSALVKVHSYEIDLDLTTGDETFIVKTRVKFDGLQPGASTFIDAVGKRVISATLNGETFETKFDGESIFLPALAATNDLTLNLKRFILNPVRDSIDSKILPMVRSIFTHNTKLLMPDAHLFASINPT